LSGSDGAALNSGSIIVRSDDAAFSSSTSRVSSPPQLLTRERLQVPSPPPPHLLAECMYTIPFLSSRSKAQSFSWTGVESSLLPQSNARGQLLSPNGLGLRPLKDFDSFFRSLQVRGAATPRCSPTPAWLQLQQPSQRTRTTQNKPLNYLMLSVYFRRGSPA